MSEPDFRPPTQQRSHDTGTTKWLLIVLLIAALGYGGWYAREYWAAKNRVAEPQQVQAPVAEPEATAQQRLPDAAAEDPAPAASDETASEEKVLHPVPVQADALPADDDQALDRLVGQWLDSTAVKFVVTPGLAHHIVATIDNLPRGHAVPRLWPIYPVGGQMELGQDENGMRIAQSNSARYDAVVGFVTGIEPAKAAQWYRQAYPVLQQSYENLGYPGKYFNDRLVAVIDHLLQTPEPQEPLQLRLVQVQGQVASQQPWLRYEYADAQLQALSAGQKILLRMGAQHRSTIKTYLQALRGQIAG